MDMSTATRSCDARKSGVTLRLFLVRHGETEANVKKLVVGQSDSVRVFEYQRVVVASLVRRTWCKPRFAVFVPCGSWTYYARTFIFHPSAADGSWSGAGQGVGSLPSAMARSNFVLANLLVGFAANEAHHPSAPTEHAAEQQRRDRGDRPSGYY